MLKNVKALHKSLGEEMYKWRKRLLISDRVLILAVFILLGFLRPDLVVISVYVLIIPYLLFTKRVILLRHFAVANIFALIWMIFAQQQYHHNFTQFHLFGLSIFPLLAWSVGLLGSYMFYEHYEPLIKFPNFWKRFLLYCAFYITLLLFIETIAYHLFDIKNLATATYAGLPLCDCIHAPHWMQAAYMMMGPMYFLVIHVMKLPFSYRQFFSK